MLVAVVAGQSYGALDAKLQKADEASARAILQKSIPEDSDLFPIAQQGKIGHLRKIVAQRARAEAAPANGSDLASKASGIKKSNPLFRDDGEKESSNWLATAYERLGNAIVTLLQRNQGQAPNINLPNVSPFGPILVYAMWGILGALLAVFLYIALRHMSWKAKLKRKATALLDEDEPERTLDEWLTMADELEREGKYREAVRCLYLACLLKFDEHRVARFDRGQTNWEHLKRIEGSPSLPPSLDFRSPTQAFDRIWYGMLVNGRVDVDRFRGWYGEVTRALAGGSA